MTDPLNLNRVKILNHAETKIGTNARVNDWTPKPPITIGVCVWNVLIQLVTAPSKTKNSFQSLKAV